MVRSVGEILSCSGANGWGFISSGGEDDVIFHQNWMNNGDYQPVRAGDLVEFDLSHGETGPEAHNIKPLSSATLADQAPCQGNEGLLQPKTELSR